MVPVGAFALLVATVAWFVLHDSRAAAAAGECVVPAGVEPVAPADRAPRAVTDPGFWDVVEQTCRVSTDGDRRQGRALRAQLAMLDPQQREAFERTFLAVHRTLATPAVRRVANDACLPGLGLGTDLGADFRSWLIAHGQTTYDAVLADPTVIRDLPDLRRGCGQGELFGSAAGHW